MAVALAWAALGAFGVAQADDPVVTDDSLGAAQLLVLANLERAAAGLPSLQVNANAADLAVAHSRRMAAAGDIFHNDGYFTAEVRQRLGAKSLGENVAMNRSVDDAHRRLMLSPDHRANLLNPKFTEVGMAVARSADGMGFLTQDFLEPAAARAVPNVVATPAPAPEPAPPAAPEPAPVAPAPVPAPAPAPAPAVMPAPAPAPPAAAVGSAGPAAAPVAEATTTTALEVVSVVTEPISSSPTPRAATGTRSPARGGGAPTLVFGTVALAALALVAAGARRRSRAVRRPDSGV